MRQLDCRRRSAARAISLIAVCAGCGLSGCEQYERAPLDLADHRAALDERLIEVDRLDAFLERLRDLGAGVPETLSLADGLMRSEGEVVALFYNAELRQARLAAGVALATFENAGLWEDPVFGFDGAEIISPSGPFEFGLMLSLTIPVSGRLEVEKSRAGAAYESELRRIVDAEWRTRADVRRAWTAWTAAEERVRLHREVIEQVEWIESIIDRLEAVGELSRIDARLFRIELVERRAALIGAESDVDIARVELLGRMGLRPEADVELVPALLDEVMPEVDDAVGRLIEANTELAVRRAEYQLAEETLRLEIQKQYPDITIGGGYGNEDDDRLLLGVSMPIPILNANRAGIAEARAAREVARAAAEITFERLDRALAQTESILESTRAQREQYGSAVVPMLDEQLADVDRLIELGEVDALFLLETVTRHFDAKDRFLNLRLAELDAETAIVELLGPDASLDPTPVDVETEDNDHSAEFAAGGDR